MDETASELETDPSSSSVSPSASQICEWIREQDLLKQRLVTEDNFPWKPPSSERLKAAEEVEGDALVHVGGLDISFCKEDPSVGCATLVVLDLRTLSVILEESAVVRLKVPAGKSIASVIVNDLNGAVPLRTPLFLVPERPTAPVLLSLLETVKKKKKDAFPQLIMVDGNGILHPQGFGLACHLGVLADLPSIGIGKNLHFVDGLSMSGVKQLLRSRENFSKDAVSLIGSSGRTWGVALRPTRDASKPIFVSVGHRISLDTAVRIVRSTCKYRNPEPVRQADIQSRVFLRRKGFVC